MDRSSKSTAVAVMAMIAVFVSVIGTVAWISLRGVAATRSDQRTSRAEEEKQRADEAVRRARQAHAEVDKQKREEAAKVEAERLAPRKDDSTSKGEEASGTAAKNKVQEAERNAAAALAREAGARQKRRRGLLANRSIPTSRFNAVMCAEKSAAEFEKSLFADAPDFKASIHFFDVSTADGSLIVHLTKEIVEAPEEVRKSATDAVVRAWRESRYTQRHGFSAAVEFRYGDKISFTEKA